MTRALEPEHDALQADFERRLFESAREDSPPPGATERAWLQFAAAAGALTPHAAAPASAPWFRGARVQALKWTLIGAVGGGSLVALWWRPVSAPVVLPEDAGVAALARSAGASVAARAPLASSPAGSSPATSALEQFAASSAPPAPARRRERAGVPSPVPNAGAALRESSPAESLLAREVAALDAARTAVAVGANASALRQIEQYRRNFPVGELSAEADVVAIEALAAEGDRTPARRAAQAFLARHPHDPHVARVRELGR